MTVVRKMILLVTAAVIGLVVISWVGQRGMATVYEKANFGNTNTVPALAALGDVGQRLGRLRVRVYRHVLSNDPAEQAKIELTIKEAQDGIATAMKDLEKTIDDDKDRKFMTDTRAAYKAYSESVDKTALSSVSSQDC